MNDLQAMLGAGLAGRYSIEEELGQGGMAVVYRALDHRHHRAVAIKVLRPGVVTGDWSRRFLQEIRVLGGLVHPHIVPLYDSGELPDADGLPYFVMPLLTGESLRERMHRGRPLPLDRVVRLGREVAGGLDYAHRQGVIHRDIKPENIFLHDGAALVTDFGIARMIAEAASETRTGPGLAVGTPAYMSPEQVAGDEPVDGRTDQYSLACVLHELLTGEPPFQGSARTLMARHVSAAPPSIRARRPDLPPAIEAVILRALAKQPEERYPTAAQFAAALGTPLAGLMPESLERAGAERTSLVVLPFRNVSPDPGNAYLGDGITEELITNLAQVRELRVASRSSSFALRDAGRDARAIGSLLGVDTLLEGSVHQQGDRLRVTAQLSDTRDDRLLWSDRYERDASDLLAVQEEIARTIVRELRGGGGPLAAPERPGRRATNAAAYAFYLRGRHAWNQRTAASVAEAIRLFETALQEDPRYALALSGLADAYALGVDYRAEEVSAGMTRAREYALRALELDEGLAEAHTSLAWVSFIHGWDWAVAGTHFRRAIELDPRYPTARQWHAWYLAAMGHVGAAVVEARKAAELDPASPSIRRSAGWLWYYARDAAAGIDDLRRAVVMNPESSETHVLLGHNLAWAGEYEEADLALRQALALHPDDTTAMATQVRLRAFEGRRAEARDVLDRMVALEGERYVSPSDLAKASLALGEAEAAFRYLERAYTERRGLLVYLRIEPVFDPIRSDPRFAGLVARMGLT